MDSNLDLISGVDALKLYTSKTEVEPLQCFHSRTASFLVPNWQELWNVSIPRFATSYRPYFNQEINFFSFKELSKDSTLLAGVLVDNVQHLIVTVTRRQQIPICSTCNTNSCLHYKAYESRVSCQDRPVIEFRALMGEPSIQPADPSYEIGASNLAGDHPSEMGSHNYDNESEDSGSEGENVNGPRHYLEKPPVDVYHKLYGFNHSKILYPFSRSRDQQQTWMKRVQGINDFPDSFVPLLTEDHRCQHGFSFSSEDNDLVLESESILVFNSIGQQIYNVKNYARRSVGDCRCLLRYDGNPQFLWNLGSGRIVNYTLLHQYLHLWKNDGLSIHAFFKSISEMSASAGLSSSLLYDDIHRSICGFFFVLSFDESKAFQCPKHGSSPVWLNTDGKCLGPTKKRVKGLKELEPHEDDTEVFSQSTTFQDRVLLPILKERSAVTDLVTGRTNYEEFVLNENITSENGLLVTDLVCFLMNKYADELPKQYATFLSNISKTTSVRGLLQVSCPEPLQFLEEFCQETLDLRDVANVEKIRLIMNELPAFWPILNNICLKEESRFLPRSISKIVVKLLEIRRKMFENACERNPDSYFKWTGGEHQTQGCRLKPPHPPFPAIKMLEISV